MLAAVKTAIPAEMMPSMSMMKGGNTMANSTAVAPLRQETKLGLRIAIMAYPNRIQLVLVIEVMPETLITLMSPGNND
jgi:hypothetical protein